MGKKRQSGPILEIDNLASGASRDPLSLFPHIVSFFQSRAEMGKRRQDGGQEIDGEKEINLIIIIILS